MIQEQGIFRLNASACVVFMGVFEEDKFTFEEDKADKSFTCRLQQFTANPQKSRNPLKSAKIQKFSALELELKCFFFVSHNWWGCEGHEVKKCGDSRSSKKIWNQFVAEFKKWRKEKIRFQF